MSHESLPTIGRVVERSWDGFKTVEDIEYFEGPLFSTRRAPDGSLWLWSWRTQDDKAHRWLVGETDDARVADYKAGRIDLRTFMVPVRGALYLVDTNGGTVHRTAEVAFEELPEDYLPEVGVGYAADLAPGANE